MDQDKLEVSLRSVINQFDTKTRELRVARDDAIRKAAELGMRQVDIARVTGYTRETIRQIVKAGKGNADA